MQIAGKKTSGSLIVAVLGAALLIPMVSFSQETEDQQAAARAHYQRGKELYDQEKFVESLEAFQLAYDTKPHPVVLKSVAECKTMLGDITGAIEVLEKFLADPISTKKEQVELRVGELRAMLGTLEITSEPAGADVSVNGVETGQITPMTVEVNPGEVEVILTTAGYEPLAKKANVERSARVTVTTDFATEGTAVAPAEDALVDPFADEEEEEEEEEDRAGPPPAFWVCAALTGVGLVTGTVFGVLALGDEDEFKDDPTQSKLDAGQRNAIIADVSFGVAAASAVVGTIILITYDKDGENEVELEDSASGPRFDITPLAGAETLGVNARVSF